MTPCSTTKCSSKWGVPVAQEAQKEAVLIRVSSDTWCKKTPSSNLSGLIQQTVFHAYKVQRQAKGCLPCAALGGGSSYPVTLTTQDFGPHPNPTPREGLAASSWQTKQGENAEDSGVLMLWLQRQPSLWPLTAQWLTTGSRGNSFTKHLPSLPQRHRVKLGGVIGLRLNKTKGSPNKNERTMIFLRKLIELVITQYKDDKQGSV